MSSHKQALIFWQEISSDFIFSYNLSFRPNFGLKPNLIKKIKWYRSLVNLV